MDTKKSTKGAPSEAAATAAMTTSSSTTNRAAALPRPVRRVLQNFLLVWLDANFNESSADFKTSLKYLRQVVTSIETFTDAEECAKFLDQIKKEKAFMIVSGALGRQVVPEIESKPQLEAIYVFCGNKAAHEPWANKIPKVKGVYTDIKPICKALQIDRENCDRAMVSISFNGIDALFMYTQLLKEAILQIEDDDKKSLKELGHYCRQEEGIPEEEIVKIEREYRSQTPIWWYTAPYFLYSMLNRGLRLMDTEIIMKTGFFIRHLQKHMDKVHREQQAKNPITKEFTVYRGQGLSHEYFNKMKKSKGRLMALNNFLSTSYSREISIGFARQSSPDLITILFVMKIDPHLCEQAGISFVDVTDEGYYKGGEKEILFATHSTFRILRMNEIKDSKRNPMWEVHLTLVGENDQEMGELTRHVRKGMDSRTGWDRLGEILFKIGQSDKAKILYQMLLDKASSDKERADYLLMLGLVYYDMGEYSKALSSYEQSLEIMKVALPPNHPDLATSYNNIGLVYYNMGEYSKALSSYEQSLEIMKVALPPNHPDLATSYNNIGLVYYNMGEYSKALSSYEQSLEIMKVALPPNHPDLAASYNNIGNVYKDMGEYSKALSSHEQSLEIRKVALPPNHPDLAASYNNIGSVYDNMGEYSNALSSYERSLEIKKVALPPNHPSLAGSYNNIGMVYDKMGKYSKALSYYERSLEIYKAALPPNHPNLAGSYNNIGLVYKNIGEYSKALSYLQKAHDIDVKVLPPTHPALITTKNLIEQVKKMLSKWFFVFLFLEK